MITRTATTLYERERAWFYAGVACCTLSVLLYMYFLSASVVHVVMRKEIDKEMAHMSSEISGLEAMYIETQHAVSEDIATMSGFERADSKIFIDRTAGTLSLSSN